MSTRRRAPEDRLRGRSRAGRLAHLDRYLWLRERDLLTRPVGGEAGAGAVAGCAAAPFVDVGIGDQFAPTLESAAALRAWAPDLPVVGIDIDAERVRCATARHPQLRWVLGDPLAPPGAEAYMRCGPARVIRVMNVLRDRSPREAVDALERLVAQLVDGGLLIEGSCGLTGSVSCATLICRDGAQLRRSTLFSTSFEHGFGPWMFRDWLPRDLHRRVGPGDLLGRFFRDWHGAFLQSRAQEPQLDDGLRFVDTAQRLAARRSDVDVGADLVQAGQLRLLWPGSDPQLRFASEGTGM